MALLGTLKGFGVTEILQLISQQMKTGSLILTSPKEKVTISFNEGVINGITSDRWEMDPRAEMLLKARYINEKELKTAIESRKKNSPPWYEILISRGKLKKSLLDKASDTIIRVILLDIFQWGDGSYRFEDWDSEPEDMLPCQIATEGAILDTLRVIDEWPLIKSKIPPADYCPVTIMPITQDIVKSHDLNNVDMHIFDLIDASKSIDVIVRESLEPPFEALNAFVKLIDANLVEVFPQGTRDQRDLVSARQLLWGRIKRISVFVLLGFCVLGLLYTGNFGLGNQMLTDPVIREHHERQKQISDEFLKREIGLSDLDKDTFVH